MHLETFKHTTRTLGNVEVWKYWEMGEDRALQRKRHITDKILALRGAGGGGNGQETECVKRPCKSKSILFLTQNKKIE